MKDGLFLFPVKIFANVALGKPAIQSSTITHFNRPLGASLAVDGNRDVSLSAGSSLSCTHTFNEVSPWWRVDLKDFVSNCTWSIIGSVDFE